MSIPGFTKRLVLVLLFTATMAFLAAVMSTMALVVPVVLVAMMMRALVVLAVLVVLLPVMRATMRMPSLLRFRLGLLCIQHLLRFLAGRFVDTFHVGFVVDTLLARSSETSIMVARRFLRRRSLRCGGHRLRALETPVVVAWLRWRRCLGRCFTRAGLGVCLALCDLRFHKFLDVRRRCTLLGSNPSGAQGHHVGVIKRRQGIRRQA